ncbi:MAG: serine/threonine-protein kinase [Polyangiales bacterium]
MQTAAATSPAPTPPTRAAQDLAPGVIFSERFRIVCRLAAGGVGNVYEAVHVWTGRRVALKMLQPERAENVTLIRRFQIEAEAATRVAHPNVVEVIDMGRDQKTGALYLVQEFLEGADLFTEMTSRERYRPDEVLAVMGPVMRALQAAHARGVLHRDLKPENIFLARGPDGAVTPKVIDFGLARLLTGATRVTEMGVVQGTPAYMSPEQVKGAADVDARSDVWSAGVIWYELLTGRQPFDSPQVRALFDSIVRLDPPRLTHLAPSVPAAVERAVHRALEKDRERRFASMGEFLDALTAACAPPRSPSPAPRRASAFPPRSAAIPVVAALLLTPAAWLAGRHRAEHAAGTATHPSPAPAFATKTDAGARADAAVPVHREALAASPVPAPDPPKR